MRTTELILALSTVFGSSHANPIQTLSQDFTQTQTHKPRHIDVSHRGLEPGYAVSLQPRKDNQVHHSFTEFSSPDGNDSVNPWVYIVDSGGNENIFVVQDDVNTVTQTPVQAEAALELFKQLNGDDLDFDFFKQYNKSSTHGRTTIGLATKQNVDAFRDYLRYSALTTAGEFVQHSQSFLQNGVKATCGIQKLDEGVDGKTPSKFTIGTWEGSADHPFFSFIPKGSRYQYIAHYPGVPQNSKQVKIGMLKACLVNERLCHESQMAESMLALMKDGPTEVGQASVACVDKMREAVGINENDHATYYQQMLSLLRSGRPSSAPIHFGGPRSSQSPMDEEAAEAGIGDDGQNLVSEEQSFELTVGSKGSGTDYCGGGCMSRLARGRNSSDDSQNSDHENDEWINDDDLVFDDEVQDPKVPSPPGDADPSLYEQMLEAERIAKGKGIALDLDEGFGEGPSAKWYRTPSYVYGYGSAGDFNELLEPAKVDDILQNAARMKDEANGPGEVSVGDVRDPLPITGADGTAPEPDRTFRWEPEEEETQSMLYDPETTTDEDEDYINDNDILSESELDQYRNAIPDNDFGLDLMGQFDRDVTSGKTPGEAIQALSEALQAQDDERWQHLGREMDQNRRDFMQEMEQAQDDLPDAKGLETYDNTLDEGVDMHYRVRHPAGRDGTFVDTRGDDPGYDTAHQDLNSPDPGGKVWDAENFPSDSSSYVSSSDEELPIQGPDGTPMDQNDLEEWEMSDNGSVLYESDSSLDPTFYDSLPEDSDAFGYDADSESGAENEVSNLSDSDFGDTKGESDDESTAWDDDGYLGDDDDYDGDDVVTDYDSKLEESDKDLRYGPGSAKEHSFRGTEEAEVQNESSFTPKPWADLVGASSDGVASGAADVIGGMIAGAAGVGVGVGATDGATGLAVGGGATAGTGVAVATGVGPGLTSNGATGTSFESTGTEAKSGVNHDILWKAPAAVGNGIAVGGAILQSWNDYGKDHNQTDHQSNDPRNPSIGNFAIQRSDLSSNTETSPDTHRSVTHTTRQENDTSLQYDDQGMKLARSSRPDGRKILDFPWSNMRWGLGNQSCRPSFVRKFKQV